MKEGGSCFPLPLSLAESGLKTIHQERLTDSLIVFDRPWMVQFC